MIKITIDKDTEEAKKEDYLKAVKDEVVNRINFLKMSLEHLQAKSIDLSLNIRSFKVVTRNAIKIINEKKFKEEIDYDKPNYKKTIGEYIALGSSNKLSSVNIQGIEDLLENLLQDDGKKMGELLICPANELLSRNHEMMAIINPSSDKELKLIKLVFNYDFLTEPIKEFFNDSNFIDYCPYCNLEKVEILPLNEEEDATAHQLDHFFSQTDYPLLSYSMFNLVPSGSICNSKNKGTIFFTDEYNLNPYIGGFGENARFIPIKPGIEVTGVDIKFNCSQGSKEIKQLIGDVAEIDELHDKGNINVFKLKRKYSDKEHVEWANILLGRIHNAHNGTRSIFKFLKLMKNANLEDIHLEWYKNQISTPFYSENFGSRKDSKFNRDIHDYYFEDNKSIINKFFQYVGPFLKKY